MATARELLAQADALMRRNRLREEVRASPPAEAADFPVLTEVVGGGAPPAPEPSTYDIEQAIDVAELETEAAVAAATEAALARETTAETPGAPVADDADGDAEPVSVGEPLVAVEGPEATSAVAPLETRSTIARADTDLAIPAVALAPAPPSAAADVFGPDTDDFPVLTEVVDDPEQSSILGLPADSNEAATWAEFDARVAPHEFARVPVELVPVESPSVEQPATAPPAEEPPVEEPPVEEPPVEEPPVEVPPIEVPPVEVPPVEVPPVEVPPVEVPPAEEPPVETPPGDEPQAEALQAKAPPAEEPSTDEPLAEPPAEIAVVALSPAEIALIEASLPDLSAVEPVSVESGPIEALHDGSTLHDAAVHDAARVAAGAASAAFAAPAVRDAPAAVVVPAAVAAPADGPDPAAAEAARWNALAEEIRMQVLQRIDIFTDTGLQEQLTARLQPIVDRASADLVATINQQVGQLLRAYVAEAIEREIDRWRNDAG